MKTTYKTLDVPSISPQNIGVKLLNKNTVKTIIPAKQLTLYCSQPIENYKIPMLTNCTCCCAKWRTQPSDSSPVWGRTGRSWRYYCPQYWSRKLSLYSPADWGWWWRQGMPAWLTDLRSVPGFSPDVLPGRGEVALVPGAGGNTVEDTQDTQEDSEEEPGGHLSLSLSLSSGVCDRLNCGRERGNVHIWSSRQSDLSNIPWPDRKRSTCNISQPPTSISSLQYEQRNYLRSPGGFNLNMDSI